MRVDKKVLLIGGGIGQLHLAQKLHDRGICFIIIAYHVLEEISSLATKIIKHDLFDLEGVLAIAKEEGIEAVLSDQHDLYIPTVAYVAERMGIPGNTYQQVMTYCDKNRFRDVCDICAVPVPRHARVTKGVKCTDLFNDYPVMVKPADSQSSVGISKVDNCQEIPKALELAIANSRTGEAIVEDYVTGREIVSEGLIYNGVYYNLALADRKYFAIPGKFIPAQTLFPANVPMQVDHDICLYESRIASFVKPHFAIVHTEWLWNEAENKLVCVESALRGGGVFISSHIIPLVTGLDINELLINFALGEKIEIDRCISLISKRAAGYICFYLPQGKIKAIRGVDKLMNRECVDMVRLNSVSIGDYTHEMNHKGNRMGPIIMHANNRNDLEDAIRDCMKTLIIEVVDENGSIKGPIWD